MCAQLCITSDKEEYIYIYIYIDRYGHIVQIYLPLSRGCVVGSDFLAVELGDVVAIEELVSTGSRSWWIGYVIHIGTGARNSKANSLFQVVDIDTGLIKTINADLVSQILRKGQRDSKRSQKKERI